MIISYSWLKEFVPSAPEPRQTAAKLSAGGLSVESVAPFSAVNSGLVVGEILSTRKHPNADRLTLCEVDAGEDRYSVVCGAPNARAGLKAPFAPVGTKLTNGMEIKAAKIRGIESQGMLCSPAEIGAGKDSDGLMELAGDTMPGEPFVVNPTDWILNIEVTPNRGDVLSVLGVARQLAAILGVPCVSPADPAGSEPAGKGGWEVDIEKDSGCGLYTALLLEDIKIGPSPGWMQERLLACGLRPISNVVDITNYVLLELGHPLHAFDAARLKGKRISARRARKGESMKTLDGQDRKLDPEVLVIADDSGPVALAGIMGGAGSEISQNTRAIMLEAAWFDPVRVRRGAKALGISTESSYRFERGVDPEGAARASRRAARLLQELAGAKVCSPLLEARGTLPVAGPIKLSAGDVSALLGVEIGPETLMDYCVRIGCKAERSGSSISAIPPSWRLDLKMPADLIEEFATLYGYESLPVTMPVRETGPLPVSKAERAEEAIKRALTACGYSEAKTYSFMSSDDAEFLKAEGSVKLLNPMVRENELLRTSLLPGLLRAAAYNLNHGQGGVRLFELGRIFARAGGKADGAVNEAVHLALVCAGQESKRAHSIERKLDIYDVKGGVSAVLRELGIEDEKSLSRRVVYDRADDSGNLSRLAAQGALLRVDGKATGALWRFEKESKEFDLPAGACFAEICLAGGNGPLVDLLAFADMDRPVRSPSPFPRIARDISLVVPAGVNSEDVRALILASGEEGWGRETPLASAEAFDLYEGRQIEAGTKSLAFRLIFQSLERTLTEAEVDKAMQAVFRVLGEKGLQLRAAR